MCKKQTSVSHSPTEAEIISLDAGQTHYRTGQPVGNTSHGPNKRSHGMFNVLNNVDCVPSNVQFSHQGALLYVSEENEAVIKMITKGRSPTMRHVSRTHRVALDWLFDRINLDPKNPNQVQSTPKTNLPTC